MQNKKDFFEALKQQNDGNIIQYYENLCNDFECVFEAYKKNTKSLRFASEEIKNNITYIKTLLNYSLDGFYFLPDTIKNNKEYILDFIKNNQVPYLQIPEQFKKDQEINILFLKQKNNILKYIPLENRSFLILALALENNNLYSTQSLFDFFPQGILKKITKTLELQNLEDNKKKLFKALEKRQKDVISELLKYELQNTFKEANKDKKTKI